MNKAELTFICVGPQRTATSWLDQVLRHHSDIALPEVVKETFFLDRRFDKGWDWYWNTYFPGKTYRDRLAVGEIAPTLFDSADAISRLQQRFPQCRIIICLRDPVARSLSLFEHYVSISRVPNHWEQACQRMPSIVEASGYRMHVARWVEAFGADHVLLVSHKGVSSNPEQALSALCTFLGIAPLSLLPAGADQRYGVAARPRSRVLVQVFDRAAWVLRGLHLHGLVNLGKRLGLKKLAFSGGERPALAITQEQKVALTNQLAGDLAFVEAVDHRITCTAAECADYWGRL